MTTMDILFWLLVVLMGGIGWAVEAGLGQRHRRVLVSSMLASLGSALFIMFWVDDSTKLEFERQKAEAAKKSGGGDRGGLEGGNGTEGGKRSGGGNSSGSGTQAATNNDGSSSSDGKSKAIEVAAAGEVDNGPVEYSRTPFRDCPGCPQIVIVPKGASQIGSAMDEAGRTEDELAVQTRPVEKVFAIGRLELLRGEYEAFVKETSYQSEAQCDLGKRRGRFNWQNPGFEQDPRHPAVCLNSDDVNAYLGWLGEKSGRPYRLPTELEWEHAARAGTTTPFWHGSELARHQANYGRTRDGTTASGSFQANGFGIADFIGNAAEMTGECMPEPPPPPDVPVVEKPCRRIVKGGAWSSAPLATRHAAREILFEGKAYNHIGFRVVRDIDERDKDKILSLADKKALAKIEQDAADIANKEREDAQKAKQDELTKKEADEKAAATKAAAKAAAASKAAAKSAANPKATKK